MREENKIKLGEQLIKCLLDDNIPTNIKLKKIQNQGYIDKLNPPKNKSTARKRKEGKSCQRLSLSDGHMGDFFFFAILFFRSFQSLCLKLYCFQKWGKTAVQKHSNK